VSFNNRVSIRDGVGNQSGVIRSGGGSFPSNTVPSDDAHILLVDIKKTVEESPMDSKAQERVISESAPPFLSFFLVLSTVDPGVLDIK
jgi:hypothetical protein